MKAIKVLGVNKMLGSIKSRAGAGASPSSNRNSHLSASATTPADNPEATAHNNVKAFCESGGSAQSEEVLFLPPIVDAAESSPAAAAECARVIRKYLAKDYFSRPSWQYNALMLVRILTDNPGQTFTRNLDKFVDTAHALLKNAKDLGVRQLLMETLDDFERTKADDANLGPLLHMWKREKDKALKDQGTRQGGTVLLTRRLTLSAKGHVPPPVPGGPAVRSQNYFARSQSNNQLPQAVELASRLEEAQTSAKLLEQVVMNTPPAEMLDNDLIREFANRCLSASRSIQGYMVSENPAPDNDTMESLIDTNEQLQTALSQHQRAVLSARKQLGPAPAGPGDDDARGSDGDRQDAAPLASGAAGGAPAPGGKAKGKRAEVYGPPDGPPPPKPPPPGQGRAETAASGAEDPFADGQAVASGKQEAAAATTNGDAGWSSAPRRTPPLLPRAPAPRSGVDDDEDLYAATPESTRSVSRF